MSSGPTSHIKQGGCVRRCSLKQLTQFSAGKSVVFAATKRIVDVGGISVHVSLAHQLTGRFASIRTPLTGKQENRAMLQMRCGVQDLHTVQAEKFDRRCMWDVGQSPIPA